MFALIASFFQALFGNRTLMSLSLVPPGNAGVCSNSVQKWEDKVEGDADSSLLCRNPKHSK